MAAELVPDLLEKILIGFDVKELIQFKRVCKSWYSLISSSHFIKAHLNHSNINDRKNRKIAMAWLQGSLRGFKNEHDSYLLGSSNGLVCMSTKSAGVFVANPLTNEVKKFQKNKQIRGFGSLLCWGFGYDSLTDDYKVIFGFGKGENRTCFHVLSLKSNVWKDVGEVKSRFITQVGILCNGALHWFMNNEENNRKIILSFRLSEEEFKEIPQPNDDFYQFFMGITYMRLGIRDECLCIYWYSVDERKIWMMKEYNVKCSWRRIRRKKSVDLYHLRRLDECIPYGKTFCHDYILNTSEFNSPSAPTFVPSLVSPHCHP